MDCNFITTSSIYLTFYVAWNKFKAKVWPKLGMYKGYFDFEGGLYQKSVNHFTKVQCY